MTLSYFLSLESVILNCIFSNIDHISSANLDKESFVLLGRLGMKNVEAEGVSNLITSSRTKIILVVWGKWAGSTEDADPRQGRTRNSSNSMTIRITYDRLEHNCSSERQRGGIGELKDTIDLLG